MDGKKVHSDIFMMKLTNQEMIETSEIFNTRYYDLQIEMINKYVDELKLEISNKSNQISNDVKRVDDKFEAKYENLLDKIEAKYDRLEQRIYYLFYAVIGAILAEIFSRYGKNILSFLLSQP
ncbi:hypothetical protein [Veillonella montpellierensis]|uniref:hypothetical protein n=1 Tax=Veillonella montpellierensis TaxID=187328 RepID=UPI0023F89272|nr:hypothetical protein [Veillonella montpellierensis]